MAVLVKTVNVRIIGSFVLSDGEDPNQMELAEKLGKKVIALP